MGLNFHRLVQRNALCVYQANSSFEIEVFSDGYLYVTHVKHNGKNSKIHRSESLVRKKSIQIAINSYKNDKKFK
ncbi:hypothetical protein LIT32_07335 [Bacillus sp. CMF21]|nr:hypothetical protein LIT32_07335 [Bacillus sp. CMF21]